eukprot:899191-Pyramimonas_sp.AAC.1
MPAIAVAAAASACRAVATGNFSTIDYTGSSHPVSRRPARPPAPWASGRPDRVILCEWSLPVGLAGALSFIFERPGPSHGRRRALQAPAR